jgi:rhomboid protease GluP
MLALLFLGPFLEGALGRARFLVAYLASGMGAMAVVVALVAGGALDEEILVGASGCIMGLVGATTAVLLRGWARERARVASRRLAMLLFLIAFQVVFDLATPQVSLSAHLGGVLIGFAVASVMKHRVAALPHASPAMGHAAHAQGTAP